MSTELIFVLVLAAVAAVAIEVYRRRRALPGRDPKALPEPSRAAPAETPADLAEDARDRDEPGAKPDAEASAQRDAEPEATGPQPDRPAPDPEPAKPEPAAVPRFAPPPPVVGPPPKVAAPVPLPRERPKAPVSKDPEAEAKQRRIREQERYRKGLAKTRGGFVAKLARLFRGKPKVDDDLKEQIEEVLFTADIGAATAERLLARVTAVLDRKEVADEDAVWAVIRGAALEALDLAAEPLDYEPEVRPYVLLMIGVNGVGKTTTLGKLAARHVEAGRKVLLVAGDTFRAAATEQLDVWARRVGCEIHSGKQGADPSSVIFDGIARAQRERFDVVLCDTAGRLHTRKELMDELAKVGRAATKAIRKGLGDGLDPDTITGPHDTFLVLDATIGQNALAQARLFKETIEFTGLVLTKLDGTAKGGVLLGICEELEIPVRFIGVGEGLDDLRDFDAEMYCDVLFSDRDRPLSEAM